MNLIRKTFATSLFFSSLIYAIDVNPSKETVPRSTYDSGGNRFSIFNGDPKRIQRANAIDFKSFDASLQVTPNPAVIQNLKTSTDKPGLKISFAVHNHGRKTYTLSFPTAQRWDFRIISSTGTVIYTYADDHEFMEVVGTSMVNQDDKLVYSEQIDLADFTVPLTAGKYVVQAILSNYPEINAQATLEVFDTQPQPLVH